MSFQSKRERTEDAEDLESKRESKKQHTSHETSDDASSVSSTSLSHSSSLSSSLSDSSSPLSLSPSSDSNSSSSSDYSSSSSSSSGVEKKEKKKKKKEKKKKKKKNKEQKKKKKKEKVDQKKKEKEEEEKKEKDKKKKRKEERKRKEAKLTAELAMKIQMAPASSAQKTQKATTVVKLESDKSKSRASFVSGSVVNSKKTKATHDPETVPPIVKVVTAFNMMGVAREVLNLSPEGRAAYHCDILAKNTKPYARSKLEVMFDKRKKPNQIDPEVLSSCQSSLHLVTEAMETVVGNNFLISNSISADPNDLSRLKVTMTTKGTPFRTIFDSIRSLSFDAENTRGQAQLIRCSCDALDKLSREDTTEIAINFTAFHSQRLHVQNLINPNFVDSSETLLLSSMDSISGVLKAGERNTIFLLFDFADQVRDYFGLDARGSEEIGVGYATESIDLTASGPDFSSSSSSANFYSSSLSAPGAFNGSLDLQIVEVTRNLYRLEGEVQHLSSLLPSMVESAVKAFLYSKTTDILLEKEGTEEAPAGCFTEPAVINDLSVCS